MRRSWYISHSYRLECRSTTTSNIRIESLNNAGVMCDSRYFLPFSTRSLQGPLQFCVFQDILYMKIVVLQWSCPRTVKKEEPYTKIGYSATLYMWHPVILCVTAFVVTKMKREISWKNIRKCENNTFLIRKHGSPFFVIRSACKYAHVMFYISRPVGSEFPSCSRYVKMQVMHKESIQEATSHT